METDLIATDFEVNSDIFIVSFNLPHDIKRSWFCTVVGDYIFLFTTLTFQRCFEYGKITDIINKNENECYKYELLAKFDTFEELKNILISHLRNAKIDKVIKRINK